MEIDRWMGTSSMNLILEKLALWIENLSNDDSDPEGNALKK